MIDLWLNITILILSTLIILNIKKIKDYMVIYDYPDNERNIHSVPIPLI